MNLWQRISQFFARMSGSGFLCDTCKYNYGSACLRPERPNAKTCPDFKKR